MVRGHGRVRDLVGHLRSLVAEAGHGLAAVELARRKSLARVLITTLPLLLHPVQGLARADHILIVPESFRP